MNVLTVKISAALEREITRAARRQRISKSELARRAMLQYVSRSEAPAGARSAADLAGHLIGSIRGLPRDLSTNPRYLDDYGR
jgi:ABC-type amino acid transport substrate-binding protein